MFNGPTYEPEHDEERLELQIARIKSLMLDHSWRTLREISNATDDPEASISAQLRHLRKSDRGSYVVEKRARGGRKHGLYEYRLQMPGYESEYVMVFKLRKKPKKEEQLRSALEMVWRDPTVPDAVKFKIKEMFPR